MSTKKDIPDDHPVKAFLETTSVKGVPRMMKSHFLLSRILWGIGVLLGATIAVYLLTKLSTLYLSHKVTLSIAERLVASNDFPSLTLCNLNPIANTNQEVQFVSVEESLEKYRRYIKGLSTSNKVEKYVLDEVTDPYVLFVNFFHGEQAEQYAEHFIVTCQWHTTSSTTEEDCLSSKKLQLYEAQYGYCFTFEPPQNTGRMLGFSAILYIDDSIEMAMPWFALRMERSFAKGAVLAAHRRNSLPDIDGGIILSAGTSSEVGIFAHRREKLSEPFTKCKYTPKMPVTENYSYTCGTCRVLCYQNKVVQECGCVDSMELMVPFQLGTGTQFCGRVDEMAEMGDFVQFFSNQKLCLRHWFSNTSLCHDACPTECADDHYKLTRSQIEWPHPTSQIAFYDAYIHGKPYKERFQVYGNLSAAMDRGGKIPYLYDILRKEESLKNNFLEVGIVADRTQNVKIQWQSTVVSFTISHNLLMTATVNEYDLHAATGSPILGKAIQRYHQFVK